MVLHEVTYIAGGKMFAGTIFRRFKFSRVGILL